MTAGDWLFFACGTLAGFVFCALITGLDMRN